MLAGAGGPPNIQGLSSHQLPRITGSSHNPDTGSSHKPATGSPLQLPSVERLAAAAGSPGSPSYKYRNLLIHRDDSVLRHVGHIFTIPSHNFLQFEKHHKNNLFTILLTVFAKEYGNAAAFTACFLAMSISVWGLGTGLGSIYNWCLGAIQNKFPQFRLKLSGLTLSENWSVSSEKLCDRFWIKIIALLLSLVTGRAINYY